MKKRGETYYKTELRDNSSLLPVKKSITGEELLFLNSEPFEVSLNTEDINKTVGCIDESGVGRASCIRNLIDNTIVQEIYSNILYSGFCEDYDSNCSDNLSDWTELCHTEELFCNLYRQRTDFKCFKNKYLTIPDINNISQTKFCVYDYIFIPNGSELVVSGWDGNESGYYCNQPYINNVRTAASPFSSILESPFLFSNIEEGISSTLSQNDINTINLFANNLKINPKIIDRLDNNKWLIEFNLSFYQGYEDYGKFKEKIIFINPKDLSFNEIGQNDFNILGFSITNSLDSVPSIPQYHYNNFINGNSLDSEINSTSIGSIEADTKDTVYLWIHVSDKSNISPIVVSRFNMSDLIMDDTPTSYAFNYTNNGYKFAPCFLMENTFIDLSEKYNRDDIKNRKFLDRDLEILFRIKINEIKNKIKVSFFDESNDSLSVYELDTDKDVFISLYNPKVHSFKIEVDESNSDLDNVYGKFMNINLFSDQKGISLSPFSWEDEYLYASILGTWYDVDDTKKTKPEKLVTILPFKILI